MLNTSIKYFYLLLLAFFFISCTNKDSLDPDNSTSPSDNIIRAADISFLPQLRQSGHLTYDSLGNEIDLLLLLKNRGFNTIRVRLWNNPDDLASSLDEVSEFAEEIRNMGLKVWLNFHYSDTWADPGVQTMPKAWGGLSMDVLCDSIYNYTSRVLRMIKPDYVQLGNEINNGFLWPAGEYKNRNQFIELLQRAISASRSISPDTKIIIHYAGFTGANNFYTSIEQLDYDIIALSYYPYWHGKSLRDLRVNVNSLKTLFEKDLVIAENSYPFAELDNTDDFLIEGFPPTKSGQYRFVDSVYSISTEGALGKGLCLWGGVYEAYRLPKPQTQGHFWENQALLDYSNHELPVLSIFQR